MPKRQWSTEFTPGEKELQIHVSHVPFKLRRGFSAKCKRLGISQRNLLLGWIQNWLEGRRPDEGRDDIGRDTEGVASAHESV